MPRSIDDLKRWKSYEYVMAPSNPRTKQPKTAFLGNYNDDGSKKFEHKKDWPDEELMKAECLAKYERESKTYTADFDDKDYVAHGYCSMLPDTFTDGKIVDGKIITTHKTYKINGAGPVKFKYPPKAKGKEDGLLLETIYSTNTIFEGGDRIIINDVPPVETNVDELEKKLKLICFFTEVEKHYDVGDGARDDFHLKFTGCLARLNEQEYPTDLLDMFHEQFLINVNDTTEIKKRLKIARQRKNLEAGKNVYGIKDLASYFNVKSIPAYDLLKPAEDAAVDAQEDTGPTQYPLIDGNMRDVIEYPPVEYLMEPIINTRSFNQTFGWYESGKTIFGMTLLMSMSSGHDFLGWTNRRKIPTAYLESELPGDTIKGIEKSIRLNWLENNKTYNAEWDFKLNQDDLINAGFKFGFHAVAVAQAHGKDAAKDYGRKGREFVENWLHQIEKKTGHKPFYSLDNMTKLATIDENKATDWNPFTNWGTDLKHKGFSGMFVHHANKGTENKKGSSGSSTIGRLLDTSIQLTKLENDYRFDIPGQKSLQSSIEFDKSRGFGGSEWAKKRIITMNECGEWNHYPYLKQVSFEILKLHNAGVSQQDLRKMAESKEIGDPPLSAPSVDRLYLELKKLGLIDSKRETRCWSCKQPISTDEDGSCEKCKTGIPCSKCGKCICEKPKKKK